MAKRKLKPSGKGNCFFCGKTHDIELHHIIQKRFNGSDSSANLVPICSNCHRKLHWITDQLLDYLLIKGKIHNHEVRTPTDMLARQEIEKPEKKKKTTTTKTATSRITITLYS